MMSSGVSVSYGGMDATLSQHSTPASHALRNVSGCIRRFRPARDLRYATRLCPIFSPMARIAVCMLLALFFASAGRAAAGEHVLRLQMSPYTLHYDPKPDHDTVWGVGIELERSTSTIHGLMYFRNSFGQKSVYLYPWGGVYRNLFNVERLYFKWSIGILWGYKDP